MVERGREGGRCDYCLVGSQKNRSAQKYVVRERGTVSDIINTLETYSESARPRARSHMLMNTHVYSCAHAHTHVITHKVPVCTKQAVFVNIKSYKHTATQITSAHNVTHSLSTDCYNKASSGYKYMKQISTPEYIFVCFVHADPGDIRPLFKQEAVV